MLPAKCQEYLRLLEKHFAWLFDEFGFAVLQVENGSMDSCSFLLQGRDCRLFIAVDRGRIGLTQIAMVPRRSHKVLNLPGLQWYALDDVINYLLGHFPNQEEIQQRFANAEVQTLEDVFVELSATYRPLWSDVMTLFREDNFESEKAKLDHAIREGRARLHKTG